MTEPTTNRPLRAGDPLPEFSGTTDSGKVVSRSDLLGRTSVVFFYPKAGSLGCSMESREFAKLEGEFTSAGATVVGVSVDSVDAQQRFRESCGLPFDLVSDADGSISLRFGVLGSLRLARRTTFVVGPSGTVVEVIRTWRPRQHAEIALDRVRRIRTETGPTSVGSTGSTR